VGPYWGPGYIYAYPNAGQVKLDTKVKDAHLCPGSYHVEIREGGRTHFAEKIYVAAGKTLHLHPEL
jgi:hypothetical protein